MSCCQRFLSDFKRPMFGIDEDPHGKLDMDAAFHIGKGASVVALIKFVTFGLAVATLVYAFTVIPEPQFYPAYLTPWGVFFGILQLGFSFIVTAFSSAGSDHSQNMSVLVKLSWFLYSIAGAIGICITILFWFLVFDPNRENDMLEKVMTHGGVVLIVVLQGNFLDKVPMRMKHIVFSDGVAVIFSIWLALQNTVVKYNPRHDDDDDALYDSMKFREETTGAIIQVVLVVFVAVPVVQTLLWMVSLCGRRYLPSSEEEVDVDDKQQEMEKPAVEEADV